MQWEWLIGAIIAVALVLYLGYTLIRPEQF
ncbi:MAG: K(+)-transporting ATPase subunit F [candidate division GAL15 bacterium]